MCSEKLMFQKNSQESVGGGVFFIVTLQKKNLWTAASGFVIVFSI